MQMGELLTNGSTALFLLHMGVSVIRDVLPH